ncbi:MAG TPA: DUF4118 domain-containing protein, partial [Ktedonobacteraceae bacterium]
MSAIEHVIPFVGRPASPWYRYLLDSFLAILGSMLVTAGIFFFHLYPRIPNISIVYLLVILWLACIRGSYAAIFASLVAFLSFDFFLIPPFFTFVINEPGEWIALIIFLINAILTSQLAVALRHRADQAAQREHETNILYDLVKNTNREEKPELQLQTIAQTIVHVFSSWGVRGCSILQPDTSGTLRICASACQSVDTSFISPEERSEAEWVLAHGQPVRANRGSVGLIPLQVGQKVVGIVRLSLLEGQRYFFAHEHLEREQKHAKAQVTFFWNFLEQAASLIEQARLHQENLRMEILQRTDALRSALLSSVSHDLRTPLTAIKASSNLLQEEVNWDGETRRSLALSIEREADRLNRLVNNLLDMSRIEEGKLKPEKDWYMLEELIQDVLERLQLFLHDHPVHTSFADNLPAVPLDAVLIDQVFTNLLENAARYTPEGSAIDICVERVGS